jgi:hypothetical protein
VNPIYIYAPEWRDTAAGIKVLHLLCHHLNNSGVNAWLVIHGPKSGKSVQVSTLNTPRLTKKIAKEHRSIGLVPIVVYPETIYGNPLRASIVVRYLLNYPGILGGPEKFDKSELLIAISRDISKAIPCDGVLWMPTLDEKEYPISKRNGHYLLYAGKYRDLISEPNIGNTLYNCVEIFRHGKERQTPDEVKDLLGEAKLLYVFENTMLSLEARISGVPVVVMKSPLTESSIGLDELGVNGIAFSEDTSEIDKAIETVHKVRPEFITLVNQIPFNVEKFNELIQSQVGNSIPPNKIRVPMRFDLHNFVNHLLLGFEVYRRYGIKSIFKIIRSRIHL